MAAAHDVVGACEDDVAVERDRNVRGYRGPVAPQRQPNELRFVFVGGTRAFGWGQPASGTTVAAVRFELSRSRSSRAPLRPLVAVNLGQIGARPEDYAATLDATRRFNPITSASSTTWAIRGPNRPFDASGIFTVTGYRPMLPLVLYEKGTLTSSRAIGVPLVYAATRWPRSIAGWLERQASEVEAHTSRTPTRCLPRPRSCARPGR